MNTPKVLSLALTVACLTITSILHAQYVPNTGPAYTAPLDFEFKPDGTLFLKGSYGPNLTPTLPSLGSGSRFLWFPKLAALRAGFFGTPDWNESLFGNYSVALGYSNTASGSQSLALGANTSAGGISSSSFGYGTSASGSYSTSFGQITRAVGSNSTAFGASTWANQNYTTAFGNATYANGVNSTAFGCGTRANSDYSTAIGMYNSDTGAAHVENEPLFQVGNGTPTTGSNALSLDKSGNLTVSTVTVTASPAAGDIPMFGH